MLQDEEVLRVDFNATDRAKASLLGVMGPDDREAAGNVWDDCQLLLGSDNTLHLLKSIRTIKMRKRSSAPLEKDLCTQFNLDTNGMEFMKEVVRPNAERLASIRTNPKLRGAVGRSISKSIGVLNWAPPELWVPGAMRWLEQRGLGHQKAAEFFLCLERLVMIQKISAIDLPRQECRINRLIAEIDSYEDPTTMREFNIEDTLALKAIGVMRKSLTRRKPVAAMILARVSVELGNDPWEFNVEFPPTIEHVLPRKPPARSGWYERFPSKEIRSEFVNVIGNLTLLTREENQIVGNHDWSKKKPTLSRSKFHISRVASKTRQWTPESISQRTDDIIELLFKSWDLPKPEGVANSVLQNRS